MNCLPITCIRDSKQIFLKCLKKNSRYISLTLIAAFFLVLLCYCIGSAQEGRGSLRDNWQTFWDAGYIKGTTVIFINTPQFGSVSFLAILYIVLLIICICTFFIYRTKMRYIRAFVLSSIIIGFLFTVRMDYMFYKWRKLYLTSYDSVTIDEKISRFEDTDHYFFADKIKKLIPDGHLINLLADDEFDRLLIKYHLMPLKVSDSGSYIIGYRKENVLFDPITGTLRENHMIIAERVELIKDFGSGYFLFKRKRGGPK